MKKEDKELLEQYWLISDYALDFPFQDAEEEQKIAIYKTLGFQLYVLRIRIQELIASIKDEVLKLFPWLEEDVKE